MGLNGDSTLLLAAALHGAGLSVLLWRTHTRADGAAGGPGVSRTANRCLAALTMIAALRLLPYAIGYAGGYDRYRWLTFAPFDFSLALGPLMWGYVSALTTGALPPRWRFHLIPAAAQATYFLACFALPIELKWGWYTGAHLHVIEPIGLAAVLLSVGGYGAAACRRYVRHQAWLADNLSNREEFRLCWLELLFMAVGSTWAIVASFYLVSLTGRQIDYFDRWPALLWLAGLVYALGLAGWRYGSRPLPWSDAAKDPAPVSHQPTAIQPSPGRRPTDPPTDYTWLARDWAKRVADAGWWRDPTLTRDMLAHSLDTSPRTLSRVLNDGLGQSFNEFVNRLRVDAVIAELRDAPGERDMLQVAFDAGFNSKASFNRAFKAYTGVTPSEFREAARRSKTSQVAPTWATGNS